MEPEIKNLNSYRLIGQSGDKQNVYGGRAEYSHVQFFALCTESQ